MNQTKRIRLWLQRRFPRLVPGALLLSGLCFLNSSCGRDTGPPALSAPPLIELALSPSNPTVADTTPQRFTLRGRFADGQVRELSAESGWAIRDAQGRPVAAAQRGLLEGAAPGHYTVTATYGDLVVTTALHVNAATLTKLTVSPSNPSIAKGTSQAFTATGTFSDGTTQDLSSAAAWAIKDVVGTAVATIDSTGVAVGKSIGKATISAKYKTRSASTALLVTAAALTKLSLSPSDPSILKGGSQQFLASGVFSDGTTQDLSTAVSWSVSDLVGSGVAAIDGTGHAYGRAVGKAEIAADYLGLSGNTTLSVTDVVVTGLTISPTLAHIARGATQQFLAVASFSDGTTRDVTGSTAWTAVDKSGVGVAGIDAKGLLTAHTLGSSLVTARYLGQTAATPITVDAVFHPETVPAGATGNLIGIWGTAKDNVWTVGALGNILHFDGTAWALWASPTTEHLYGLWGSSASDIWTVGTNSTLLHWDGHAWSKVPVPVSGQLYSVWGTSSSNVWIGGIDAASAAVSLHFDGSVWSRIAAPAIGPLWSLWGSSATDVWACGNTNLLHWNGAAWTVHTTLSSGWSLYGLWGSGANDVWATGGLLDPVRGTYTGGIWHWNGTSWTAAASPTTNLLAFPWGTGARDVWVAGWSGTILHWDGSSWTAANSGTSTNLIAPWGIDGTLWVNGWNATLLRYP